MVSRRHAVLKRNGEQWTIMDNKSINGVYVNDVALVPLKEHDLTDGDLVRIGVAPGPAQPVAFVWSYHKCLKVTKYRRSQKSPEKRSPEAEEGPSIKKMKVSENGSNGTDWSPSAKAAAKMKEAEKQLQERLLAQEEQLAQLQKQLQEKTAAEERYQAEIISRERAIKEEMHQKQKDLEDEKEKIRKELRAKLEEEIKEKEEILLSRLAYERDELQQEKNDLEERLRVEKENKEQSESTKEKQTELIKECERLAQIIEKKESEQRMLKSELQETKCRSAKQNDDQMLEVREELLRNFANLMETELQCSICNELFVQATSLNCSHSFCSMCITNWMAVKRECPVCRAPITSHLKAIVLDTYIDRMVENFSDEMKEVRKNLVAERKAEEEKKKAQNQAAAAQARAGPRVRGRGRRRGRGTGRGRAVPAPAPPPPPAPANHVRVRRGAPMIVDMPGESQSSPEEGPAPTDVINISDVVPNGPIEIDSDDDDDEVLSRPMAEFLSSGDSSDSDDADYVRGIPGSYYGGFGTCFRCGNRGHWAPGCPF